MAVFRYRMQSVLEIKEKMENQSKLNYATSQQILTEAQNQLEQCYRRKAAYEEIGVQLRTDSISVTKIKENADAIKHMKQVCEEQEKRVETAQKNLEVARRLMMEARKETKTQEKLKEHAFDEFYAQENRKENKEIDELTNYRFSQKETGE